MAKQFTYTRKEKFKSKKELNELFRKGKSFLVFPLKVMYSFSEMNAESLVKFGVGVGKKQFANATDRNRIKRLLREAYRINKLPLYETVAEKQLNFFVIFIDKQLPESRMEMDSKMQKVISKLLKIYNDEAAAATT